MRGAGDQLTVGERIAFYRRRRGLTQAVLAGLVGRSEDWLSKIERGERQARRLDVLADLARALRVTIGDLLGQPVLVGTDRAGHDDIPAIRDSLMSPRRLSKTLFAAVEPALPVDHLTRLAEAGWNDFQKGRLGKVVSVLPTLITGAQAVEGPASGPRNNGWAVSARVHHLAATALAKVGEADLAWMAAERAMSAADQSEDPLVLASAARAGTHALLAVGRYDDAMALGMRAAEWLRGRAPDGPAALSLLGMLYLRSATAAARRQDRSTTSSFIEEAERIADQLGVDGNYWQTGFGPTNVRLHRVSAALELGDVETVLNQPRLRWTPHLPQERAAEYHIALARALSMVARDSDSLEELLAAEALAPELVRHSAVVRETLKTMYRRSSPTASKSPALSRLAQRCSVLE
ncbi:transcriptional regulator [Kribbella sp. ALI-6-A]|uniref:helix-turn-helix domain-containing protein n=1 Tax=Kribbella sp. ALI-6-A TaxID=1933817 RepID=UPI00097C0193|nr:helix-turn-helix transcriptional regulator [Kribbella sp. ALI-6-A]ONI68196.1 transcriptional regulator [Kribbella sp. ALI-6-A]